MRVVEDIKIRSSSENYGRNFLMDWDDVSEVARYDGLPVNMIKIKPGKVDEFNDFGSNEEKRLCMEMRI